MRHFILSLVLLTLTAGCADTQETEPPVGDDPSKPGGKADLYGTDDRREVFDAEAVYQRVADSTALVVASSDLYLGSNGHVWVRDISAPNGPTQPRWRAFRCGLTTTATCSEP